MALFLAGTDYYLNQMTQLQVNLEQCDFCLEVYHNVFLMFANKNLFILDINFHSFYSYATY